MFASPRCASLGMSRRTGISLRNCFGQAKGNGGRKPADQRGLNRAADGSRAGKAA